MSDTGEAAGPQVPLSSQSHGPQTQPGPPASSESLPAIRSIAGLLVLECLFTVVGGFTDAYAFIAHGRVFANAQTGNVVLFAVYATQGAWKQSVRHIPPILACIAGVSTARLLGAKSNKRTFRATLICEAIELAVVSALCVIGSRLPKDAIVPILSFVAALQITSFDRLGPWSFNSAMTTGNLKTATSGVVLWLLGRERANNKGKALIAIAACISFLAGALYGGVYTRAHPASALWPCAGLLLLGMALTLRERQRFRRSELPGRN